MFAKARDPIADCASNRSSATIVSCAQTGDLRWIDYERGGATLALELTGGRLTCVQLYGEGYA